MTRILYWNINNFSMNKINNLTSLAAFNQSLNRKSHIVNSVMGANVPDIFVVVEVYSRTQEVSTEGTVIDPTKSMGKGVLFLLDEIRAVFGNKWCVVPPLNLGSEGFQEGVAVYFDSTKVQFTGPNFWVSDNEGIVRSQPPHANTVGGLVSYGAIWKNCLPYANNPLQELKNERTTRFTYNGNNYDVPEYQLAGQCEYYTGGVYPQVPTPRLWPFPNRIFFPYMYNRGPFYTKFADLTTPANNRRTLKLFAVHTSPATAADAVARLAQVYEIMNINAGEVSVVLGDFNVDTFTGLARYAPLEANYTMALNPRDGGGAPNPARRPYCLTHLLPTDKAYPYNNNGVQADPQHNVYPRYGYMGNMGGVNFQTPVHTGSIDNVFTWYGGGAAVGPAQNISVVNTVVGKPYNAVPGPQGVTAELTGGLAYNSSLANPLTMPTANPATHGGVDPNGNIGTFQGWNNFGVIHSVSDHLALIIDV